MKKTDKTSSTKILLTLLFLMIALSGNSQRFLKPLNKESTDSTILKQVSQPAVKRMLLRVLEGYPLIVAQRDSCENIVQLQKKAETNILTKIEELNNQQEKAKADLLRIETRNASLKKRLNWWRTTSIGLSITLITTVLILK